MYSLDYDLEIIVEDAVIPVHSYPFMMVSRVFRQMLQSGSQETQQGRIVLKDKKLSEFEVVLPFIDTFGSTYLPHVTLDNVMILLKWANEYQMELLTQRCEDWCTRLLHPGDMSSLSLALEFKLPKLLDKCVSWLSSDIVPHLPHLGPFLDNDDVMGRLWPSIVEEFGVPKELCDDSLHTISSVWPLISKGCHAVQTLNQLTFASVDDIQSYVYENYEPWVIVIPDADEVIRLCCRCAPGAESECGNWVIEVDYVKKHAGSFLCISDVTDDGHAYFERQGFSLPYDALLRPKQMYQSYY